MTEGLPVTHTLASVSLNEWTYQVRAGVDTLSHCFKDRNADCGFVAFYLKNALNALFAFMGKSESNHASFKQRGFTINVSLPSFRYVTSLLERTWVYLVLITKRHMVLCTAAAAKSPQSCPTLSDPIDSSPPGSPIPGILQARTLEQVAISFSSAWKWKVKVKLLGRVWLFALDALYKRENSLPSQLRSSHVSFQVLTRSFNIYPY